MSGRLPGKIRIVGGARRGRRLKVAAGTMIRPTAEKVREAMFDALGPVGGLSVLDLFAGTGAMGLEALSRGASACVFVEKDPAVAAVLQQNIAMLDYETVCRVMVSGYDEALKSLARGEAGFDLLFIDPPYRMLAEVEVTLMPLLSSLLSEDGVAVIEGERSSQVDLGRLPVFDRTYGDTRVTMIRMRRSIP
jgi:16S rRNA (guanine966-N2)-methyltransferase